VQEGIVHDSTGMRSLGEGLQLVVGIGLRLAILLLVKLLCIMSLLYLEPRCVKCSTPGNGRRTLRRFSCRRDEPDEFRGKRVLVTGGTKGSGRRRRPPHERGATVSPPPDLPPGLRPTFIQADVSTPRGATGHHNSPRPARLVTSW